MLQERTIGPVGSLRSVPVTVRVVAATHRDLEAEMQAVIEKKEAKLRHT